MKRLAILLTTLVMIGWASPLMAHQLTGKDFSVYLFDNDGNLVDWGFLYFWEDEDGNRILQHFWMSDGRLWTADRNCCQDEDDFDHYGCVWHAWDDHQDVPYDDLEGFYCRGWEIMVGRVEERNSSTKYSLYGWQNSYGSRK